MEGPVLEAKKSLYLLLKDYAGREVEVLYQNKPGSLVVTVDEDLYGERTTYKVLYNGAEL